MRTAALLLCVVLCGCGSRDAGKAPETVAAKTAGPEEPKVGGAPLTLEPAAEKQAGLVVQAVQPRAVSEPISAPGQLTLNEDRMWQVGAITDGRIVSVAAKLGDAVRKDQVLARMHSHDIHEARAAYQESVAELRRAESGEEYARRARERMQRLFDLKSASRTEVEAAEMELRNAQARTSKARTSLEKERVHITEFLNVPLPESVTDGDHEHDDREFIPLMAPAAGIVMERKVTPGTVVSTGDPAFVIADPSTLWMVASVNEEALSHLRPGQTVKVTVKAYPGESFTGRILRLGEKLDSQTRTLQVRVLVPNPQGKLKPEMFASAEIAQPAVREALFVPEAAVQEIDGRPVMFVQQGGGKYAIRPVTLGPTREGLVQIASGLQPGERVVVKGAFLLKSQLLNKPEE